MTIRILLVDDSPVFLSAVKGFLAMMPGVQVIAEAHGGMQALTLAAQLQPDLVLLDIAMPDLNGLEVAKVLGEFLLPPRIVFLSMYDNPSYRAAATEMGVYGYVGKSDFVAQLVPILDGMTQAFLGQRVDLGAPLEVPA